MQGRIGAAQWIVLVLLAAGQHVEPAHGDEPPGERLRIIVETDAGGDPDDEQSMVRFLLYANQWDVEGIICTRPIAREGENLNRHRTGLEIVRAQIEAYGQCYESLSSHDPRYPLPAYLQEVTVAGYGDDQAGVKLVIDAVDRPDPRPVWFLNWGTDNGSAPSSLKLALDQVRMQRGEKAYAAFKDRLRLSSADKFEPHTWAVDPPFRLWIDTFRPERPEGRWYHRFSALTATAGGFDLKRDVLTGHGLLGTLYPQNTTHRQKEGDSMTFLYLIPTGMNDPMHPQWGSWAGRYGQQDDAGGRAYFWANQVDTWRGVTSRDATLARWAADLQNDFRARLDWCAQPADRANHPPQVVLNGDQSRRILSLPVEGGSQVPLHAAGTTDPDGDPLSYLWFVYPEAGTYRGQVSLQGDRQAETELQVPEDAAGTTIHVILRAQDQGDPPLARYRRAILEVAERQP
jgi:hypothetical protein